MILYYFLGGRGGGGALGTIFLSVNKLVFPVHTLAGLEACVVPIQVSDHDKKFYLQAQDCLELEVSGILSPIL